MQMSDENLRNALAARDPLAALAAVERAVKSEPGVARHRIALFQVMCLLGQWKRAMNQLDVISQLDDEALSMVSTYREAIKCEAVRVQVFSGATTPLAFGEPQAWLAHLVEALHREAGGDSAGAARLRESAFDQAQFPGGVMDGTPFEWIADCDPRLGPVLEAIVNGRYYWMPLTALARVDLEAPEDLRDLVWTPAHLQFINGGEAMGLIPTRYPGSEASSDGALQLARKTEWVAGAGGAQVGMGQRMLATDAGDRPLLEIRRIDFNPPGQTGADPQASQDPLRP
jgi:type VI secretion system protein ImpE